ncbi:DegQ family serine endoprotease [Pigmentiphaga litoralis]|uniref:Probable periplasmic serine endoprotease DegP-like n=1 Tax=Pigmentiphaga litoralis TaxID=516702 RepID=A0A7Y9IWY4_9BURK|nr:DegQ family serine endoprotease [Pigmentiphaga litoralis]NYE21789.1 serine protease Do [Pigmentiphaga litoralis]NYE84596.1 serine protease Do [Pigmentiphaga litoralis]
MLELSLPMARLDMRKALLAVVTSLTLFVGVAPTVHAQARGLPDFTDLVDRADPAVVNIRTTSKAVARGPSGVPGAPGGQDPYELFRWFFGPDFNPPGGGGGGGGGQAPRTPRGQVPDSGEGQEVPRGVGSGFFISADGYALTNHHVVKDADDIYVTLTDRREFKAKVIGSDERTDVALIKIDATGLTPLKIGDPSVLRKGEWVVAIGSPFGLDSTVTAGIVSAKGRDTGDYLPFIQTDVAVNPGNSGGPLLNMRGEVVGINSQIISRSGGFMGISLSIPIDDAMRVVEQLRTTGRVTRGRIGVQISEVTKEVADAIGLGRTAGASVGMVEPGSPAEKAGIEPGDVVLKFNNKTIDRSSDLPRAVGETKPGSKATIQVWRRGATKDLTITVAELEDKTASAAGRGEEKEPAPAQKTNALGVVVSEVPAARKKELRIRGGVQVDAVDGAAARAGIKAGDILLALDNTEITGVSQFNGIVAKLEKGKVHGVLVRRDELTQWVPLRPAR